MKFDYDIIKFIKCVEDHGCIWDQSLESHKDRHERRAAWEEIFNTLDNNYEYMTASEKHHFGEAVISKWTHIRDTFQRSLKLRQGKPRRKYIYHSSLTFLLKNKPSKRYQQAQEEEDVEDEYNNMKVEMLEDDNEITFEEEIYTPVKKKPKKKTSKSHDSFDSKRERKETEEEDNDIGFVGVGDEDSRVMNEDEAFFASLLPTVVNYSEDERLDFRLEVLGVMKRIKEKRKWAGED